MSTPLVFDLDGTLVDSLPGIAAGLNQALTRAGLPSHRLDAVRSFVGNGSLDLARRALPADCSMDPAALEALFREEYAHTWQTGTLAYPGILDLLDSLRGRPLAVLSNKPEIFTREIVAAVFAADTFEHVIGQSDRFPRKPDPTALLHLCDAWKCPPSEVTLIGDSLPDLLTARHAGCRFLGVGWGYHPQALETPPLPDVPALAAALGL
ncbi:MAG: HAD-IA family hydrolase [Akkermansiaceae bacterium]|nr:HAD-IA family hydrolase [Akkermansiaceae bacterium]